MKLSVYSESYRRILTPARAHIIMHMLTGMVIIMSMEETRTAICL